MSEQQPAPEQGDAATEPEALREQKAKFREALERKRQTGGKGPALPGATGGPQAEHGKSGGRREFRRKSS